MDKLVTIKTKTGLVIDVDPTAYNDMELLDACYEVQENNNMLAMPVVLRHLLTEPARKALYEHVRKAHGRVRTEPLMEEIIDIMEQMGEARQAAPDDDPEPDPDPDPEPLFPGPGPLPEFDKTQPPPAWHVDNVLSLLHGALKNSPDKADKLEKATRAALEVARPASAWELLDEIEAQVKTADALRRIEEAAAKKPGPMAEVLLQDVADALAASLNGPADPAPTEPNSAQAVKADFVRAGDPSWTFAPAQATKAAMDSPATFTPWDELKADSEPADAASSAQQAASAANSAAE